MKNISLRLNNLQLPLQVTAHLRSWGLVKAKLRFIGTYQISLGSHSTENAMGLGGALLMVRPFLLSRQVYFLVKTPFTVEAFVGVDYRGNSVGKP